MRPPELLFACKIRRNYQRAEIASFSGLLVFHAETTGVFDVEPTARVRVNVALV